VPDVPAASNREQTQLSLTHPSGQLRQHLVRVGTGQPLALGHSLSFVPTGRPIQCSNSVIFLTTARSGSDGTTAPLLFGISGGEIEGAGQAGRKETAPAPGNRERHSTAQRLIAYGCAFRPDQVHNCPLRGTPPGSLTRAP